MLMHLQARVTHVTRCVMTHARKEASLTQSEVGATAKKSSLAQDVKRRSARTATVCFIRDPVATRAMGEVLVTLTPASVAVDIHTAALLVSSRPVPTTA